MDEETGKDEELTKDNEDIELIPMNIIDEKKQLSIRIPKKVVEALEIDPKDDMFLFIYNKKDLHLEGVFMDKKTYEKEFNNEKSK